MKKMKMMGTRKNPPVPDKSRPPIGKHASSEHMMHKMKKGKMK